MMMLNTLHSDLRVSVVARAPAPAIRGNMTGTMVADPSGPSFWNISMLNVISMASTNSTSAPASAKEEMSMLNSFSKAFPAKRNAMNITRDIPAAFSALTFFPALLRPMIMGVEPVMSITAKRTMKAVNISFILILKSIILFMKFAGYKCSTYVKKILTLVIPQIYDYFL